MMEKMIALQQKRRSKKGGFTLVELIVVLVILAILAALLIPALTGYIDKAKNKKIVAETRQIVTAAQTLFDEDYGAGRATSATTGYTTGNGAQFTKDNVEKLSEVKTGSFTITVANGKISEVKYTLNSKTCTFDGSTYTVAAATAGSGSNTAGK